ncbi:MAG: L-threonylcarbamoyladenylate synthase [Candidatus Odinarchaeota archaeon]
MQNPQVVEISDPKLPRIFKEIVVFRGGIAIIPTDTCYGLAANAFSETAIKRVFDIKKRQYSNPISVALSPVQLPFYADLDMFIPGITAIDIPVPVTLVLKPLKPFPTFVTRQGKVGFRLGGHDELNELLTRTRSIVTATSANVTKSPETYSLEEIEEQIQLDAVDLVIDGGTLDRTSRVSAVIDLTEYPPIVHRDGAVVLKLQKIIKPVLK